MNKKLENMHNKALSVSTKVKYYKRLKKYKSSNFEFDLASQNATSYGWWDLMNVQKGKVVFNTYIYSISTAKHIGNLHSIVNALGLKSVIYVNSAVNIKNSDWIETYSRKLTKEILLIETTIDRKRNKSWYMRQLKQYKTELKKLESVFKFKLTKKDIDQIRIDVLNAEKSRLEQAREKRAELKVKRDALKPQMIDLSPVNVFNDATNLNAITL
jgi:hypothetical protein